MNLEELKERWSDALEAHEQGEDVRVTDICRHILKYHPNFPNAWYMLAAISTKFGQATRAKDYLTKLLPLMGENYNLIHDTARLLYSVNEFDKSLELYNKLPGLDESPTLSLGMAKCFWKKGNYPKSFELFEKAYELSGKQVNFAIPLIRSYLSFGDWEMAQKKCAEALEVSPEERGLFLYYLMFLWSRGLFDKVEERLPAIPDDNEYDFNFFVGAIYSMLNKPLDAEEFFHPLLQDDNYRVKVESFKKLSRYSKSRKNFFVTFATDLMVLAKSMIKSGNIYEFGVYRGRSAAILGSVFSDKHIYGFDSFIGSPEQFTEFEGPGSYNTYGEVPNISLPNITYVKGPFSETLNKFVEKNPQKASLLHIDCDLYSSTKTALEAFKDKIAEGTLILFDDFVGYKGYEKHSWKAFSEFTEKNEIEYEIVGYSFMGREVLIKIK